MIVVCCPLSVYITGDLWPLKYFWFSLGTMRVPLLLSLSLVVVGQTLSEADIATVTALLAQGAKQSWELGTRAESLLELYAPQFSVFGSAGVPPPSSVPSNTTSAIAPVFSIAKNVVSALSNSTTGPQALISGDGAAGDPASIGVAVLLANWTGQGTGGLNYAAAAQNQLDYLLNVVPRTSDGAISHRVAQVQLWSDFVYMVPPFLAYYGALTQNTTLINEAYNQINLYRNHLRDSKTSLWTHIALGNNTNDTPNDPGHWSTGNAWAAAGMLRVLATMKNSPYSKSFSSQQKDLGNWVKEIHSAMFAQIDSTNIFTNYADQSINTTGSFYDTASTTLLASTVYRASLLLNDHSHLPNAEKCRQALYATSPNSNQSSAASSSPPASSPPASSPSASHSSASGSSSHASTSATPTAPSASPSATIASINGLVHFTNDGWLTPVVNPEQFSAQGQNSPEGQAFVLLLDAAYSEWVAGGSVGANAARRGSAAAGWTVLVCALLGAALTLA
ncbi:Six-hairpin glycosidase [Roridomyces roridus]|uniref:Six-hairpin glycosidase n=1 Tax=Roridomyces roridus TaxID=1738132 RepID=A0AAD7FQU3_9AGAR|nr:Six-hairpin glycosidase [Roridomyces roridus]